MPGNQMQNIGEEDVNRIIQSKFTDQFMEGYIDVGPENTPMPMYFSNFAESVKTFQLRDDDVLVASYPKAGTTWTQEMVWLIMNDCDFEKATDDLPTRFPYLEVCTLFSNEEIDKAMDIDRGECVNNSIEFVRKLPCPRFIKTHLPFSLLPEEIQNGSKSPKIIYVMRNPKDVCVSYYHHGNILQGWTANFDEFCEVFLSEKIMYGSFWKHVLGYWKQRTLPNLLIITYEDLKKDLQGMIKKVAGFLGKNITDVQMELLGKHLSFESMKNNQAVNFSRLVEKRKEKQMVCEDGVFMRSGKVGKYKEEMSSDMVMKFDDWTTKCLAGTGFDEEYSYIL